MRDGNQNWQVMQHPRTKLWFVVGIDGSHVIPVSDGYKTKKEAAARLQIQRQADAAMIAELNQL